MSYYYDVCHRSYGGKILKDSSLFSSRKSSNKNDQVSMAYAALKEPTHGQRIVGDSLWLSKKMVDDGCTLGQTLHVMEEQCKSCDVVSPMFCVDQCETWKVKKELREIGRVLSEDDHGLKLLNALKNERRLAILNILWQRPFSVDGLQKKLGNCGLHHSKKTISEYLKPLLKAGLVRESSKRFLLTLYGRKVYDAVVKHGFKEQLPIHSGGYEERILRNLLDSGKTRDELVKVGPAKSLSRVLKRLLERKLIVNNSPSARIFYFRTKRVLSLEQLSPTQKKICEAIPQNGISASDLAESVGISLRRTYKYLRSLRGKKLVFRRDTPVTYELLERGRVVAGFLEEIAGVE